MNSRYLEQSNIEHVFGTKINKFDVFKMNTNFLIDYECELMWQDLFLKSTLTLKTNKNFWVKFSQKENYFSWIVFCGEFDFFIKKTKWPKANEIFFQNWSF